jgi:hypothetical protein
MISAIKPVIRFHNVLLVRGWTLRVEQGSTRKFAEMTLKRSGSFMDLVRVPSQCIRMLAVSIFSFLIGFKTA